MTFFYLQAASVSLGVGSLVWVEDPELAWLDGEVVEVNGDTIKVACTSGKTVSGSYGIHLWAFLMHTLFYWSFFVNYLIITFFFTCFEFIFLDEYSIMKVFILMVLIF